MDKTFHLGITMAGAVSAGAYTGGVMDYLLQTLDAWEKAKANNSDKSVPTHQVSLDVISGASAGGITGGMAALALFLENRHPVTPDKRTDADYLKSNVFYNAWVNMTHDDMVPELLSDSDLESLGKTVSLLNSSFIEKLAKDTIIQVPECTTAPPAYVSRDLELILTLSNLDGFTYNLDFSGQTGTGYRMKQHRDYAFFRVGDEYRNDGRIPLNLQRKDRGLTELVQAAPATGAFPIGLAYRKFVRKKKYILDNEDLIVRGKGMDAEIENLTGDNPEEDYVTYNVDGGMLNNEPFDLTMKLMAENERRRQGQATIAASTEPAALKTAEEDFTSSIIMIDPFPSDSRVVKEQQGLAAASAPQAKGGSLFDFPYTLLQVAKRVFTAMRGELLFKGEDIVKAFSKKDFSRFMIAPRRHEPSGTTHNGSSAIACGSLGGFGGFFDKAFRHHDFLLGRANCQSFLRKHFRVKLENGVPVNAIFREGYTPEAIARFRFQDEGEKAEQKAAGGNEAEAPWYVPIIPDFTEGEEDEDGNAFPYPSYDSGILDERKAEAMNRFGAVAKSFNQSWWYGLLVDAVFLFWGNKLFRLLKENIEAEFRLWKLMK